MFGLSLPIIILIAVAAYLLFLYNMLAKMKVVIKEAWSTVDVQLKRRADLIPNIVETVKGYASHEKEVFEKVTKARSAVMNANGVSETADADNMLTGALKSLFAVAEAYPELKAQANFSDLQKELSGTEDKIAYARQFYNATVKDFNTKIVTFPNNLLSQVFGFKREPFFEATSSERENVEVKF
ncbi:LemA family protein [candidate division WWE3 bacterium]|jgi:LemA protein|nr:LemA family protein [candidate division WWE3 bacterium]MBT7349395.1 LemA family protein [candidate division WWE3 bacterium]